MDPFMEVTLVKLRTWHGILFYDLLQAAQYERVLQQGLRTSSEL